jgi:hypothetical protein
MLIFDGFIILKGLKFGESLFIIAISMEDVSMFINQFRFDGATIKICETFFELFGFDQRN